MKKRVLALALILIFCFSSIGISCFATTSPPGVSAPTAEELAAQKRSRERARAAHLVKEVEEKYSDISQNDWSFDDICYVYNKKIMQGTKDNSFSPKLSVDRAMFITMLYRLAYEPKIPGDMTFTDVKIGDYYYNAVIWAKNLAILPESGSTLFNGKEAITREELAILLYRFNKTSRIATTPTTYVDLNTFSDASQLSAEGYQAFTWACSHGIFNGYDGKLLPKALTTREEIAAVIHRYCEN